MVSDGDPAVLARFMIKTKIQEIVDSMSIESDKFGADRNLAVIRIKNDRHGKL